MNKYSETTYGETIAEVYDHWYAEFDPAMISTLVDFAQDGRALELGIGTGRIALPLQQAGIEVHGIDSSQAMLTKLKDKPGGESIQVSHGNFADLEVEGRFDLIFVIFSTFFALPTQEEQIRCFNKVASRLTPDGVFVVEVFVPDMARYVDNQTVRAVDIGDDDLRLEATQIDPLKQQVSSKLINFTAVGIRMYPIKIRYAWPSELDLMAKLAGLSLRHRWGNWRKDDLTIEDNKHISVYGNAE
ncbi:MAG: class I SAM-dependent methyltransferase [Anaerolineales bacterium]|nr:class I SAM-dependent methyltransferase [Anaerolineales bacterium]